jgi:predicted O-linked N-acetylglucosamine transferase (SPINDLY family)
MTPSDLPIRLRQADTLRQSNRWSEALAHYRYAETHLQGASAAAVKHNMAVCFLGAGDAASAVAYCNTALELNKNLWQSEVVKGKALKEAGQKDQALQLLASLFKRFPDNAEVRLELASLALHELGDARLAQRLADPLKDDPHYQADAVLTSLMARLYDRDQTAGEFTRDLCTFADAQLILPKASEVTAQINRSARRRIGIMSPQFCCSPVYFFCIGALRLLSGEFDLIVIDRGAKRDWATQEFRAIASEWIDAQGIDSEALALLLHKQQLDVLIDLGGWMDPAALRALSTKPAARMFKWVGGQSATTGLRCFDGMFTDRHQTLTSQQALYTEPLIQLKSGYVTYTPPAYMPAPAAPEGTTVALGVISNPVKVSGAFLEQLKGKLSHMSSERRGSTVLRFIDRRYRHAHLQTRVLNGLRNQTRADLDDVRVEFISPRDHVGYLNELTRLHAVLDTFPYTGGLTTIEALALGVPCFTRTGKLFSERHTYAHCKYAGMNLQQFDLDGWDFDPASATRPVALLRSASRRIDHTALAEALAMHLRR